MNCFFHSLHKQFFIQHPTFAVCDLHCLTQAVNTSWSLKIPQLNNDLSEFSPRLELLSHGWQASSVSLLSLASHAIIWFVNNLLQLLSCSCDSVVQWCACYIWCMLELSDVVPFNSWSCWSLTIYYIVIKYNKFDLSFGSTLDLKPSWSFKS